MNARHMRTSSYNGGAVSSEVGWRIRAALLRALSTRCSASGTGAEMVSAALALCDDHAAGRPWTIERRRALEERLWYVIDDSHIEGNWEGAHAEWPLPYVSRLAIGDARGGVSEERAIVHMETWMTEMIEFGPRGYCAPFSVEEVAEIVCREVCV